MRFLLHSLAARIATLLGALATGGVGLLVAAAGTVLAATTAPEIAPWAQTGGIATAVGGLAYVAKLLADGKLVAQPVADLIVRSTAREDRLEALLSDAKDREDALRSLLLARGQAQR